MRLYEVKNSNRIKNPLRDVPINIGDILNTFDDIESDYANAFFGSLTGIQKFVAANKDLIKKGKVTLVSIQDLIPIEKELFADHLSSLTKGDIVAQSSVLPLVYLYNNSMYINDGNHRVASAYVRGETQIKVIIVDMNHIQRTIVTATKNSN